MNYGSATKTPAVYEEWRTHCWIFLSAILLILSNRSIVCYWNFCWSLSIFLSSILILKLPSILNLLLSILKLNIHIYYFYSHLFVMCVSTFSRSSILLPICWLSVIAIFYLSEYLPVQRISFHFPVTCCCGLCDIINKGVCYSRWFTRNLSFGGFSHLYLFLEPLSSFLHGSSSRHFVFPLFFLITSCTHCVYFYYCLLYHSEYFAYFWLSIIFRYYDLPSRSNFFVSRIYFLSYFLR